MANPLTDFAKLLNDTFVGPTHYDSGPLDMTGGPVSGAGLAGHTFGARVKVVGPFLQLRIGAQFVGCDAAQARVIANALVAAADAMDKANANAGGGPTPMNPSSSAKG